MHVSGHRNFQFSTNRRQNLATLARAYSAKRFYRSPVRFVVGSLENKSRILRVADFGDLARHSPNKLLRLNHARTENECGPLSAYCDFAYVKGFHAISLTKAGTQEFQRVPSRFHTFLNDFAAQDRQSQTAHRVDRRTRTPNREIRANKAAASPKESSEATPLPVGEEESRNSRPSADRQRTRQRNKLLSTEMSEQRRSRADEIRKSALEKRCR